MSKIQLKKQLQRNLVVFLSGLIMLTAGGASVVADDEKPPARYVFFVGMDISGSFQNSVNYDDSLEFLARYLQAHLQGFGGLEVPAELFVGSIGGVKPGEPKTFFPIATFRQENEGEILKRLKELFPKTKSNPFTDYNAFFEQIENMVKLRNLILKPISILLISDGKPDLPGKKGAKGYRDINLKPLEMLSRNITIRLLYTDAVVGSNWQTKIPRKRVKIWTQDAEVMRQWKDPAIFQMEKPLSEQGKYFNWLKDNVDFNVRLRRVD